MKFVAQGPATVNSYQVVFQLSTDDAAEQKSFIRQLCNLQRVLSGIRVEVVAHSNGVGFLKSGSRFEEKIKDLDKAGVRFLVCRNTLTEKGIDERDLLHGTEIIPAGLAHIIVRQAEGWSYIKVGF